MNIKFRKISSVLFPKEIDNTFHGSKLLVYFFWGITVISLIRSLIHIFSPDGGAGSIAGLDLSVEGADGIVFAFALWGSSQLLFSVLQALIAFRYRAWIPLMVVLLIFEMLLRMLIGRLKPVTFAHTPPGAYGNLVFLLVGVVMLGLSFIRLEKSSDTG